MVEKEDGTLFSVPFQGSEEITSTWRGFEELRGDRLHIENFFKKLSPFQFVSGWVNRFDSEIFL
jgi:hypothetical protein